MPYTAYLAPRGYADVLGEELERSGVRISAVRGGLFLTERSAYRPVWAQNIWEDPRFIPVSSIGDAAAKLSAIQRNWHLTPTGHFRRAKLIAARLPHVSERPLAFGAAAPRSPLGSWTLWDEGTLLASAVCSSPFPDGCVSFVEDKVNSPSRAYLKLWEVFTLFPELTPRPGDLCLDMGAAPGGWSWVLGTLGASVFAIDKAPLAENVRRMPTVESCMGSGFGLDPRHVGKADCFFSDMICYPDRLYGVVTRWMELGEVRTFVCTLKCQGTTDHAVIERFRAIPGSAVVHLSCNKHEVTWIRRDQFPLDSPFL